MDARNIPKGFTLSDGSRGPAGLLIPHGKEDQLLEWILPDGRSLGELSFAERRALVEQEYRNIAIIARRTQLGRSPKEIP